jgi:hypothetical protein
MAFSIGTSFNHTAWQFLQAVTRPINSKIAALIDSIQLINQSWQEHTTQTYNQLISPITKILVRQVPEQIQNKSSGVFEVAITSYMNNWLAHHSLFYWLLKILSWMISHPIIGFVMMILMIALVGSIIKAIIRLIEILSLSVLQIPLNLLQAVIKIVLVAISRFSKFAFGKITYTSLLDNNLVVNSVSCTTIYPSKQQRLTQINLRLRAIQQEQELLLQEAANLIAEEGENIYISDQTNTNTNGQEIAE